jgi:predicted DNA-binding transcriptional regulator YafY
MNRFDRIVAILIQLQSKKIVTAQEIAGRFGVSHRTIYRDIRSLEEAGIPIVSEAGVGYSIMEGYRLPPVQFTKEEALTLVTAEKFMKRFTDYSLSSEYRSAITKIRAVLRAADKSFLESIEDSIAVLRNSSLPDRTSSIPQQIIINSIATRQGLDIEYFANHSQEHTHRRIEPIGMFHLGDAWHIIAYCHLRKGYRDFRLDRISGAKPTGLPFEVKHPPFSSYLEKFDQKHEVQEVVIRVQREQYKHLGDQKYYMGLVSEEMREEVVEMRFLTASLMGFARWYLMFADVADIVKPAELREKTGAMIAAIAKKFDAAIFS